jgi:hypothetical protein
MRISRQLLGQINSDWVLYFRSDGGNRNAPRAQAAFCAALSRGGSALNEEWFDVQIAEISVTGAGIIHNRNIAVGDQVLLHLRKDEGAEVQIVCVARRLQPIDETQSFTGIEFLHINEETYPRAVADEME